MPSLIVLRHAKAAAGPGLADIDRPLNDRGRRDSTAAGEWLRNEGLTPDLVLCSTAVRTRQTLERLALATNQVRFESQIYDNDADTLLALAREAGDEAGRVLLVGHNPSVHQLVHDLTGEAPESFPTCALAVIDVPGAWSEIRPGVGDLTSYRTPKGGA
ncbi:SixA phosphatase family protein [Actinomadura rugatobispora]|uniref:SixA phosphatase family protein n=1 Tax=Actinomadura rugatobispora TaxID=1994 RepID=A0ABW1A6C5_9ACTN|nr:histidine phosphatase family protein [Actinomadura rugatobispora]